MDVHDPRPAGASPTHAFAPIVQAVGKAGAAAPTGPAALTGVVHKTGILNVVPGSATSNPQAAHGLLKIQASLASKLTGKVSGGTVSKAAGGASSALKTAAEKLTGVSPKRLLRNLERGRVGLGVLGGTAIAFAGVQRLKHGDASGALQVVSGSGQMVETGVHALPEKLSKLAAALGPAARIGGGIAIGAKGVYDIYQGARHKNVTRVATGVVESGTGALTAAGGAAASVITKFGGAAAGAVFMIDGGLDVARGIRKHDLKKTGVGLVKLIGGGMVTAGMFCGPAAPIVAGIGMGVYYAGWGLEHWSSIKSAAMSAEHGVVGAAHAVEHGLAETSHAVERGAAQAGQAVEDAASSAGSVLRQGWRWAFG